MQLTKVRITGFEKITPQIKAKITRAISDSGFPKELRDDIVEEIRDNGIKPDLAPSSVKTRNYLSRFNATHPKYSASKSNLTFSGQLLDALRAKFVASKLIINIDSLKKKHKKFKTGGKGSKKPAAGIDQILEWQKEAGRDIAQVFERKDFVTKITEKLKKAILKFYRN